MGGIYYSGNKNDTPHDYKKHIENMNRINSSVGYVEGNVEFVCTAINMAKKLFRPETDERVLRQLPATLKE